MVIFPLPIRRRSSACIGGVPEREGAATLVELAQLPALVWRTYDVTAVRANCFTA